jgi:hypothetical protein
MNYRIHGLVLTLLLLIFPVVGIKAADDERCFAETGKCIRGEIRMFWERNGGLGVFGFPTSNQRIMRIEGKSVEAQNFERNRIELHPENLPPYNVLIGRVGVKNMQQIFGAPSANKVTPENYESMTNSNGVLLKNDKQCKWFAVTRQFVCNDFLRYWSTHGIQLDTKSGIVEAESLALFGLPLSNQFTHNINGQDFQIQIFERARFEFHPENKQPYVVLLGLLGNEFLNTEADVVPTPTQMQTDEVVGFIQFDLGTVVTSIEIAPTGSGRWRSFFDVKKKDSIRAQSGSKWQITVPIYEGSYAVDIRLNDAVVWQNVEMRNNRLVVLGYKTTWNFTGPYVVMIQDDYR